MADDSVMGLLQALGMGNMQSIQAQGASGGMIPQMLQTNAPPTGPAPFSAGPGMSPAPAPGFLQSILAKLAPMAGGGSAFMGVPSQVSGALSPAFSMQPPPVSSQQPASPPSSAAAAPQPPPGPSAQPLNTLDVPSDPAFSGALGEPHKVKRIHRPADEIPKRGIGEEDRPVAQAAITAPAKDQPGMTSRTHREETRAEARRQEEPNLLQKLGAYLTDPKDRNMWLGIASGFGGAPSFGQGLGRAASGMAAGSRQDIAEQSLNQTQAALMARGATLEEARAAASNPALLQQWLKEHAVGYGVTGEEPYTGAKTYGTTVGGIPTNLAPPVKVTSVTEALHLPKGTRFIVPPGYPSSGQIGYAP
jgi:hypothetical protein